MFLQQKRGKKVLEIIQQITDDLVDLKTLETQIY